MMSKFSFTYIIYIYISEINSVLRNSTLFLIIVGFSAFLFKTDFYQQIVLVNL